MFLFIVLLSTWIGLVPTMQANTVATSTKSVSTNQQPVQTTMPQTIEFKDLDITITTTPLSYAEVVALVPDLQENFFSRFFKTKERLFNSRYQALKLKISNQSSAHYFFEPKQKNLPFVTLEKIRSANDNSYIAKTLLGVGAITIGVLLCGPIYGLVVLALLPLCAFSMVISDILSIKYQNNLSLFWGIIGATGAFLALTILLTLPPYLFLYKTLFLMSAVAAVAGGCCLTPALGGTILICVVLSIMSIYASYYFSLKAGHSTAASMDKSTSQSINSPEQEAPLSKLNNPLIISAQSNQISLLFLEKPQIASALIFTLENHSNAESRDVAIECPSY